MAEALLALTHCDACGGADAYPWACPACGHGGLRCGACERWRCRPCEEAGTPLYTWRKVSGEGALHKAGQLACGVGQGPALAHVLNEVHQLRTEVRALPQRLAQLLTERLLKDRDDS